MNSRRNIITTIRIAIVAIVIAFAAPLFGHGGFDHVIGTIVGVSGKVLTVKTAKGNVDVKLDDKTEISKNDAKAQVTDLKPGVRVVVDIPEGSKTHIAHSVKLGVVTAASQTDHPK